jgi:predicted nuclease with TOPRIM domain
MTEETDYAGIDNKLESILDVLSSDLKDVNEALSRFTVKQDSLEDKIEQNRERIKKLETKAENLQERMARLPSRDRWNKVTDSFEQRLTNKASEQALSSLETSINSLRDSQLTRREVSFWIAGFSGIIMIAIRLVFAFLL